MGRATTLRSGTFTVGKDIPAGLYDAQPGMFQSGNFVVQGADSYNEILGGFGVPRVRIRIADDDTIQISGIPQVRFTPVSTPFISIQTAATLYAGTWTVGQDIGSGTYVATPGPNQSGNLSVHPGGVSQILGGSGVPKVTLTLNSGDIISINGLALVKMTPA